MMHRSTPMHGHEEEEVTSCVLTLRHVVATSSLLGCHFLFGLLGVSLPVWVPLPVWVARVALPVWAARGVTSCLGC